MNARKRTVVAVRLGSTRSRGGPPRDGLHAANCGRSTCRNSNQIAVIREPGHSEAVMTDKTSQIEQFAVAARNFCSWATSPVIQGEHDAVLAIQ
jgi:hypothetical protein